MTSQARADAASDCDFEWVNAWAAATPPKILVISGAMFDPAQVERDVDEIVLVRDRLLREFAPAQRNSRSSCGPATVRTSDFVPILVGGVLAITSLVVFGAAASLVSLR